jgi:hypothetical protein
MSQRESDFQRLVIEYARLLGWRVAHFRAARIRRRDGSVYYSTPVAADGGGFPDLVLARRGRVVFAELKSPRGRQTPAQEAWARELNGGPVRCYLWRPADWPEIERVLSGE